jgi:hypothetical protein
MIKIHPDFSFTHLHAAVFSINIDLPVVKILINGFTNVNKLPVPYKYSLLSILFYNQTIKGIQPYQTNFPENRKMVSNHIAVQASGSAYTS